MSEISKKLRKALLETKGVPVVSFNDKVNDGLYLENGELKVVKAPSPKLAETRDYTPDMVVWRSGDFD